MKKRFAKSSLAMAVGAALTSMSSMAFDGYAYSGETARSKSLQLDYFTHEDVGNIWVNPALAGRYDSRVMIDVNNDNNNGDGSGGILYGTGAQTFGIYIGRDSANTMGESLNLDRIPGGVSLGGTENFFPRGPENQFDLFYAVDMGGVALGARFNFQANEQSRGDSDVAADLFGGTQGNFTDFSSIDSALQNFRSNLRANLANNPNAPTTADLVFTGSGELNSNNDFAEFDSGEINFSLGFEVESLGIDGAVLFGQASGEATRGGRSSNKDYTLDNDGNDNQVIRRTSESSGVSSDKLEIDDGTTLGVSLRAKIIDAETSTLTASFAYVSQDYSGKYTGIDTAIARDYSDDTANELQGTFEATRRHSGLLKDETDVVQVMLAQELRPRVDTAVTIASGVMMGEETYGQTFSVEQAEQTVTAAVDGYNGLDAGQFQTTYGQVGPVPGIDHEEVEEEYFAIPLVFALEHQINERWTGRASVSRLLYRTVEETRTTIFYNGTQQPDAIDPPAATDPNQSVVSGPVRTVETNRIGFTEDASWIEQPTTVQFGTGYTRNNLTIDTLIGKEFFTQGTDNGIFGAVSMAYQF